MGRRVMPTRNCPVCRVYPIPTYRACCPPCFNRLPREMAADLTKLWRRRILEPKAYQEKLADAILWRMHSVAQQIGEADGRQK